MIDSHPAAGVFRKPATASFGAFLLERLRYESACRRAISQTGRTSGVFHDLRRDGIATIPDFVSRERAREIVADIARKTSIFEGGQEVSDIGSIILNDADRIGDFGDFFASETILDLARGYVSVDVEKARCQVMLKNKPGDTAYSDFFHIDHWEHKLRAFLFLEDITEDNAPLVYIRRSHALRPWRLAKEFEIFAHFAPAPKDLRYANPHTTDESKFSGVCLPPEVFRIARRNGYQKAVATGPAGTLLLFDAKGLHCSTPLRSGRRLLLAMHLDRRSQGYFKRKLDYEGQG